MDYLQAAQPGQRFHTAMLRVPANLPFQFVFRQEVLQSLPVRSKEAGLGFELLSSPGECLSHWTELKSLQGGFGAAKTLLKVARGQVFYFVRDDRQVLHTGWLNRFCNYYHIESDAIVIGPIWSSEAARNRGIGAFATQMAINAMLARGHKIFYIDTANTNLPCLKMINHCGFDHPVAAYVRG